MRTSDEIVDRISRQLERRAEELAGELIDTMRAAGRYPEWMDTSPVYEASKSLSAESVAAEQRALRAGEFPTELPAADLALLEEALGGGQPIALLADGYWAGYRVQLRAWGEALGRSEARAERVEEVRARVETFLFGYAARMSELLTERYLEGRQRRHRTTERLRQRLVRALLDGDDPGDTPLDYPVSGHHLALTLGGEGLGDELSDLAGRLEARPLVMDTYGSPSWAWLGRSTPFPEDAADVVSASLGDCTRVGIGRCAVGAEGFRESHRQASIAFHCTREDRTAVRYDSIAAEDVSTRDEGAARRFHEHELSFLADVTASRAAQLRETLLAYFAAGHNYRSAAARLGVHHQTVAQRIEAAEQALGMPVAARRLELELALRLERFLEATEQAPRA